MENIFHKKCSFCGNSLYFKWKLITGGYICTKCFRELSEKEKKVIMKDIIPRFDLSPVYLEGFPLEYCRDGYDNTIKIVAEFSLSEIRRVTEELYSLHPEEFE